MPLVGSLAASPLARPLAVGALAWGVALATGCTSGTEDELVGALPPCSAGEAAEAVLGCEAGIPEASCAAGFEPDGAWGCNAILPAEPCPPGELATPGDTSCHVVAACGDGPWGDIPTEADSQHVDGTYLGGDSDGTAARPWPTIGAAVDAASDGAIVAIAEGAYFEDVAVTGKAVRLWGRCPALVTIVGTEQSLAAVTLGAGTSNSDIRSLALSGAMGGVRITGGLDVTLEALWIHDCADRGITLQPEDGPVSATIRDVLVEHATVLGIQVVGADATLERVVVRDTEEPDPGGTGQGLALQPHAGSSRSAVVQVTSSLFERNHCASVFAQGSEARIEGSVVRDTLPSLLAARDGVGVLALMAEGRRSTLTVIGSLVERNYARGISALGTDVEIRTTHVRDTYAQQTDQSLGEGIAITNDQSEPSIGVITDSLVEQSRQSGILVRGSSCELTGTRVRDTEPRGSDAAFGRGLAVLRNEPSEPETSATVHSCAFASNRMFGVWIADAAVTVDSSIMEATAAQQLDGDYGDGLAVATLEPELGPGGSLVLRGSRVEANVRGGVTAYGAALTVEGTTFECNPHALQGSSSYFGTSHAYSYSDGGGNVCACGTTRETCAMRAP